jgi:hypothetical protein
MGFTAWFLATFWARFPVSVYLIRAGLPFVLGLLFLVDRWYRNTLRVPSIRPR